MNYTSVLALNNMPDMIKNTESILFACGSLGVSSFCFYTSTSNGQLRAAYQLSLSAITAMALSDEAAFLLSQENGQSWVTYFDYGNSEITNSWVSIDKSYSVIEMSHFNDQVLLAGPGEVNTPSVALFNFELSEGWECAFNGVAANIVAVNSGAQSEIIFALGLASNKKIFYMQLTANHVVLYAATMTSFTNGIIVNNVTGMVIQEFMGTARAWFAGTTTHNGLTNAFISCDGAFELELSGDGNSMIDAMQMIDQALLLTGRVGINTSFIIHFNLQTQTVSQIILIRAPHAIFNTSLALFNNTLLFACFSNQRFLSAVLDSDTLFPKHGVAETALSWQSNLTSFKVNFFSLLRRPVAITTNCTESMNHWKSADNAAVSPYALMQLLPANLPSYKPTKAPLSRTPTRRPTILTLIPTLSFTVNPSMKPTRKPSPPPTFKPSEFPSSRPTGKPTITFYPTSQYAPSFAPTHLRPSSVPTDFFSLVPSEAPSEAPSESPTESPTLFSTLFPTLAPTFLATFISTVIQTFITPAPTLMPTRAPTVFPTSTIRVQRIPTRGPTEAPSNGSEVVVPPPDEKNDDKKEVPLTGADIGVMVGMSVFALICLWQLFKNKEDIIKWWNGVVEEDPEPYVFYRNVRRIDIESKCEEKQLNEEGVSELSSRDEAPNINIRDRYGNEFGRLFSANQEEKTEGKFKHSTQEEVNADIGLRL